MSWGKGITITLIAFVLLISSFVYRAMKQDFNLVTKDYYEQSLEYDAVQERLSNYTKLNDKVIVRIDQEKGALVVELPEQFKDQSASGYVLLYNPTDAELDMKFDLKNPFAMSTKDLKKGKWTIQIDWDAAGKGYRHQQAIFF